MSICQPLSIFLIFSSSEVSWHAYASAFEQIVSNAETFLDARDQESQAIAYISSPLAPFLGVRSLCFRRRRMFDGLPGGAGRSGVFAVREGGSRRLAEMLGAVTHRCALIEECGLDDDSVNLSCGMTDTEICTCGTSGSIERSGSQLEMIVSKESSINVCRMAGKNGWVEGKPWPAADTGMTKVIGICRGMTN